MRLGDFDPVRILAFLRMCGVFAPQTLWRNFGMSPDHAGRMIRQLVKAGLVRKVRDGRYEVIHEVC